jgi:hypothetical protein
MIMSSVNRSSELALSPHCFPVADIAVADHMLVSVIVAPDDREFLHIETGLLQFLDRRFGDRVCGLDCDHGGVFVHAVALGVGFMVTAKTPWDAPPPAGARRGIGFGSFL